MAACPKHPKYQVTRRPSAHCLDCWIEWLNGGPNEQVTRHDLARILGIVAVALRVQASRSGYLLEHTMFRDDVMG